MGGAYSNGECRLYSGEGLGYGQVTGWDRARKGVSQRLLSKGKVPTRG